MRDAKRNFAGPRHELRQHLDVILGTFLAIQDSQQRPNLDVVLTDRQKGGWTNLVAAVRGMLAGERDIESLVAGLDLDDAVIVETILQALADPATLNDLLPENPAK